MIKFNFIWIFFIFMKVGTKETLPEKFDSRDFWPMCETIKEVHNQGPCASDWAIAVTGAISDRVCIHSNGTENFKFSFQYLLSCCDICGFGCDAGFPINGWKFWVEAGIVSGGSYGTKQGCQPYTIEAREKLNFQEKFVETPECKTKCIPGYKIPFEKDLHFGKSYYQVNNSTIEIKKEIFFNGPVVATFDFYENFKNYKSGVFKHVNGITVSQLSVRMIGWGIENGTPYWLCANSWGTKWGNKGFFKIRQNFLGIEKEVTAGVPKKYKLNKFDHF